jgi:hypothetical protein
LPRFRPGRLDIRHVDAFNGDQAFEAQCLDVYDNADWPSVHDLATALKAKVIPAKVLTPNCPIVFIEP